MASRTSSIRSQFQEYLAALEKGQTPKPFEIPPTSPEEEKKRRLETRKSFQRFLQSAPVISPTSTLPIAPSTEEIKVLGLESKLETKRPRLPKSIWQYSIKPFLGANPCTNPAILDKCKQGLPYPYFRNTETGGYVDCSKTCIENCPRWLATVLSHPPLGRRIEYKIELVDPVKLFESGSEGKWHTYHGTIKYVEASLWDSDRRASYKWRWNTESKQWQLVNPNPHQDVKFAAPQSPESLARILCEEGKWLNPEMHLGVEFDSSVPYGFLEGQRYVEIPYLIGPYPNDRPDENKFWLGSDRTDTQNIKWMARTASDLRRAQGPRWLDFKQDLWWLSRI